MVVLMTFNTRVLAGVGVLASLLVAPAVARHAGSPSQQAGDTQEKPRKTIDIVAERFLFTPAEITVDRGTTLEIRLTSEDTDHGFRILDTDIDVTIPKRGRGHVAVVFDAKDAGDYTFECSHVCGAGHSFMRGRIRVKAPRDAAGEGAKR
jgi:cytochrome c oxidase subunit II